VSIPDPPSIEQLLPLEYGLIRPLLRELLQEEQRHYDHPQRSVEELSRDLAQAPGPTFVGENIIFAARSADGRVVGMCWCVLFDPGTGLEAEVAEVFVDPAFREQGLGRRLLSRALELFRQRQVTFACVWTRPTNPQAVRLYKEAGFRIPLIELGRSFRDGQRAAIPSAC